MLPPYFVTALEMSAQDHMRMSAAVQPFVDTAISKTVNVPEDYPFADFKDLYLEAWKSGLKGLTTYRPNAVRRVGAGGAAMRVAPQDFDVTDPDRRIRLEKAPAAAAGEPALAGPPGAGQRQSVLDLRGAPSARRFRGVHRPHRERPDVSVRSLGQRRRAAARPGRDRQDAVDGHARRRPAVAAT